MSQATHTFLDAHASDPASLRWMTGAPPLPEHRVNFDKVEHFQFPQLRWAFANMRQLVPSTQIWRGAGLASVLPDATSAALTAQIDAITFQPMPSAASAAAVQPMTWQQSLDANYTDAIVVLHKGRIVYEAYSGVMAQHRVHMAMSVTKSYTGTVAQMLIHQGQLDENKLVTHYVPEMASTAFAAASVRDVLDMRTSLAYSENYADPNAGIWEHVRAGGTWPRPAGYSGAKTHFEFLQGLKEMEPAAPGKPAPAHGRDFAYKTVNTDLLGWIIRRITNKPLGELISQWFWQPLGCEEDACMLVDSEGTEFAGGGLNPCARDMARFGEAMRLAGQGEAWRCAPGQAAKTIVPQAVVQSIAQGGNREAFKANGPPTLAGGAYRSQWWLTHNAHGAYSARGIHGQAIYIDPVAQMVIARFASHPMAANVFIDPTSLPAYHALALWLLANPSTK